MAIKFLGTGVLPPTTTIAAGAATSEPNGTVMYSSSTGDPMIAISGFWYSIPNLVNTDAATGSRIFVGAATPSSPQTGDIWIN